MNGRAAATLVAACAAAAPGCGRSGTGTTAPPTQAAAAPAGVAAELGRAGMNVLVVSVDTTRADHFGCYGHPESPTPHIDRLAAEGTRFTWCISSVPLTLPSHSTMLTGSYPFVHGARDNTIFTLAGDNVTLAEIFKEAGYATHAEVAAPVLDRKYGLDQGFDTYGEVPPPDASSSMRPFAQDPWDVELGESPPQVKPEVPEIEVVRKAEDITRRGIELLAEEARLSRPFFAFLHYFDPHWPDEAPEPYATRFKEGYVAEIAYFDDQFGRLMDALRELGLAANTLVILTSDHGEGRGQHGEVTHSMGMYDSTLLVPLIMWCPGQVPAGRVVDAQVRLLDIAPTVVDFVRLQRTPQMQGTSVLPLLSGQDLGQELACYSESMAPFNSLNYSPLRALRAGGWKYILAPRPELYHVAEDPLELFDLAEAEPQRAAAMRQALREVIADSPPAPGGRGRYRAMDPENARVMAALGYVSATAVSDADLSGSELDHFDPAGVNPRDRMEVIETWAGGMGSIRIGEWEAAERICRRFVELEPSHHAGASNLGRCLMMLQRTDEAIEMYRRAVELQPQGFIDQRVLGNLLSARGDDEEAEHHYREALRHQPQDAVSHLNLGMILARRLRFDEAQSEFDEALRLSPGEAMIYLHKGVTYHLMSRLDDAASSLEEALRLDPGLVLAYTQLATVQLKQGRLDQAVAGMEAVVGSMPDSPLLRYKLAEVYTAAGRAEEAGQQLERLVELRPKHAVAYQSLGANLLVRARYAQAIDSLNKALELRPEFPVALYLSGEAQEGAGRGGEALSTYRRLLEMAPRHAPAYPRAAELMTRAGDAAGALALLRQGRELLPECIEIANDLAWNLATAPDPSLRNGSEAVELAEYANARRGGDGCNELDTLAAAYAEVGRFEDAVAAAERALALAAQAQHPDIAASISARLDLFRRGQPYRQ